MPMTPEERERYDRIDRQLEYLAAQEAQLSSDLVELRSIVELHTRQIAQQGEQIAEHGEQISNLREIVQLQGEQLKSVGDSVLRLGRVIEERDRQTAERIDALILIVERHFSNGKH